ncbi:lipoprotein [Streptosporangium fragile]|uniref:Lipoprotein n=1 Tax=Streptosporangium fragile TaxID=46186 RepID=A0ABN3W993_9ACTN
MGLLGLALALAAACSGPGGDASPTRSPAAATPSPAAAPEVTLAEAGRVLAGVLGAGGVLGAATPHLDADRRNILEQTRDGQEALTMAAFNSSAEALPAYTWGTPELLVPRLAREPAWFAAIIDRRDDTGEVRTAVLTLVRQGEDDWRLSSTSLLDEGVRAPQVAKDAEGYATALGTEDQTVAISPRLMAPLHATSAEEGDRGFAAGLIEKSPHTTGYADEIAERRLDEKSECLGYDSIFAASNYPVHALRTADGGALVVYSLIRTTTRTIKVEPCASDVRIPPDARKLTSESFIRKELRTVETQQYVSTVPAKGSGRQAKVIGYLGGLTKVTVS